MVGGVSAASLLLSHIAMASCLEKKPKLMCGRGEGGIGGFDRLSLLG